MHLLIVNYPCMHQQHLYVGCRWVNLIHFAGKGCLFGAWLFSHLYLQRVLNVDQAVLDDVVQDMEGITPGNIHVCT